MAKKEKTLVLVADTETSYNNETDEVISYLQGFTQARTIGQSEKELMVPDVVKTRTIKDFLDALEDLSIEKDCKLLVYIHNLKFDAEQLLYYFQSNGWKHSSIEEGLPCPLKKEVRNFNKNLGDVLGKGINPKTTMVSYGWKDDESFSIDYILKELGITLENLLDIQKEKRELEITQGLKKTPYLLGALDLALLLKGKYKKDNQYFYHEHHMEKKSYSLMLSADREFYSLTVRTPKGRIIKFHDSFKIVSTSLRKAGKDFGCRYNKKEMLYSEYRDSTSELSKEVLDYFDMDVLTLSEVVGEFRKNGATRLTKASCALHEFKESLNPDNEKPLLEYLKERNTSIPKWIEEIIQDVQEQDIKNSGSHVFNELFPQLENMACPELEGSYSNWFEYLNHYYRGAWTYCKEGIENKVIKKGCTYDVNSLYPSVMMMGRFPVGDPLAVYKGRIPNDCFDLDKRTFVEFKASFKLREGKFPFVQVKDHSYFRASDHLRASWDYNVSGFDMDKGRLLADKIHGNNFVNIAKGLLEWDIRNAKTGQVLFTSKDETGKELEDLCRKAPRKEIALSHDFSLCEKLLGRFSKDYQNDLIIVWHPILRLYMVLEEFDLFLENYEIEDFEIIQSIPYQAVYGLFDGHIIKHRDGKIQAAKEGKDSLKQFHKDILNSTYGKFGTKPDASFKVDYLDENGIIHYKTIADPEGKKAGFIPIAACITADARIFTIRAAQANYDAFLYADTDSIHLNCDPSEVKGITVDDNAFSCWKCESVWKKGVFFRQKAYIEYDKNNKVVFKMAGVGQKGKIIMLCSEAKYKYWESIKKAQLGLKDNEETIIFQDLTKDQMLFLLGSQDPSIWHEIIQKEKWALNGSIEFIKKEIQEMYMKHDIKRDVGTLYDLAHDIVHGYTAPVKTSSKIVKGGMAILDGWFRFKKPRKIELKFPEDNKKDLHPKDTSHK